MSEFSSTEFLDENEARDYPLVAGSSLPTGFILDLRMFSRGRKTSTPRVVLVEGAGESVSGDLEISLGTGCLNEDGDAEDIVTVRVSDPGAVGPATPQIQVFGWTESSGGGVWSSACVTIGPSFFSFFSGDSLLPASADIEPALLYLCHAASVHSASVSGAGASGRVAILPSRNSRSETTGGELVIGPEKGAGLAGMTAAQFVLAYYPDMDPEDSVLPCTGMVLFLNGTPPDPSGAFSVVPGRGVSIRTFPESNMVAIVTSLVSRSNTCPDIPTLGDIYLWLLDENGNLVPTEALPELLEPGQAWVLDQFGRLVPAEEFDFDPYWGEGGGGISP
jgi:hypothetical protein